MITAMLKPKPRNIKIFVDGFNKSNIIFHFKSFNILSFILPISANYLSIVVHRMPSLAGRFERRQCIVTGARCRIGADGSLREWFLFCTPNDGNERCNDFSLCVVMEVCRANTIFVYELAERGLFHPKIIEFTVEESDVIEPWHKKSRNFSVVPSEPVDLELSFRVHLSLLEPFFLHWLIFDHWLRLLSILCFVCPRLSFLTLSLSFIPPALRWVPVAAPFSSVCAMTSFADAVSYAAQLMERMLMTAHTYDRRRVQWLWVKLSVVGLCESEFVKLGILRRSHSLFMTKNGPGGWNSWHDHTHVIYDQIGREHWLTITIANPGTMHGILMDEEEEDKEGTEKIYSQTGDDESEWDDQESVGDEYCGDVDEENECYSSDDSSIW